MYKFRIVANQTLAHPIYVLFSFSLFSFSFSFSACFGPRHASGTSALARVWPTSQALPCSSWCGRAAPLWRHNAKPLAQHV
jgi:hypothetical protein